MSSREESRRVSYATSSMAYLNLMYRERADLECEDLAARQRDLKTADQWVDKTLAVKKASAEKGQVVK